MDCADPQECTLDATKLSERIEAWRDVSSLATSRTVEDGRITSVYRFDPEVVRRLEELIDAEAQCCAFLEFTLRRKGNETIVETKFPSEARPLVESLMAVRA